MAKTTDLTKLEHMYVNGPLHFYYDTDKDGRRVLCHIRFHQHGFEVPADGVTIDVVPADSVGSEQIKDEGVEMQDLSKDVRERLSPAERVTKDELNNFNA